MLTIFSESPALGPLGVAGVLAARLVILAVLRWKCHQTENNGEKRGGAAY